MCQCDMHLMHTATVMAFRLILLGSGGTTSIWLMYLHVCKETVWHSCSYAASSCVL
jgi:hypothetical protein